MKEHLGHKIKALIDVGEKKLIDYQLSWVTKLNPENLIIVIGQEHQILADHIGYNYNGVEITYVTSRLQVKKYVKFMAYKKLLR